MTSTIDTQFGARVVAAADAFTVALTPAQRAELLRRREPATMRNWSNYPQQVLGRRQRRGGLATGSLTGAQWGSLDALLDTAMGEGAQRLRGHLAADDHLHALGGSYGYGRGEFVVAFLGEPTVHGTWQLQFGGHHLAVAHTYRDGRLVGATPSFRGIEPFVAFTRDGRSFQPERATHAALTEVLASLDDGRRVAARLRGHRDDLLLGPGRDWDFPAHRKAEGLVAAALDEQQRALLRQAIASFVDDVAEEAAESIHARYDAELAATHLGWSGGIELDQVGDYVRIGGPSVWIEFSLQDGIVCAGTHPHAVWRDRTTDYGGTRF